MSKVIVPLQSLESRAMYAEARSKEFPLLKTGSLVAFIDDDRELVESLEVILPPPLLAKASLHTSVGLHFSVHRGQSVRSELDTQSGQAWTG